MTDELAIVGERVRQAQAARRAALAAAAPSPVTAETRLGIVHPVGARVFDPVSGQHGEVISGTAENFVVSTAGR